MLLKLGEVLPFSVRDTTDSPREVARESSAALKPVDDIRDWRISLACIYASVARLEADALGGGNLRGDQIVGRLVGRAVEVVIEFVKHLG